MSNPTGSDPSYPQGGAPQGGQPGWNPPQQQPPAGYNPPGYNPAPSYTGGPPATGQKPGMVTAAGIIAIVWGGLGLLLGLLALTVAFTLLGALYGILVLISLAVAGVLLYAGIQVQQGKSPRLLLLICYISIGINLLSLIWAASQGASIFSGLLGFIIPGVIVALLLNPQSKQYYASRGISY
jgi:hypothetical protein